MPDATATSRTSPFIARVIRWRVGVLALWAIGVTVAGVVYLSNFRIDNSVAIWFLEDDPELETYRRFNREFGEREWTYIWLRGDSVFAPEFLRDLRLLRERIESFDEVNRVQSLTEAGGVRAGPGGVPMFEKFYTVGSGDLPSAAQASDLRRRIRGSPQFVGRLVPPQDDPHFTIVAVQNVNRIDAIEPYRIRLLDEIRAAIASCPGILEFGIVGTTVINAELNRAAKRDMLIYYALIAAFVLLGGGLALRRTRDLVVLCAVVIGSVLPVMGCIAALGLPFNLMTIMLPTLLVTVSVSYLIHFISEFHILRRGYDEREPERLRDQAPLDPAAAISATFRRLLRPGMWTSVTTAIGFASLTVSPVAPIRYVGLFAAVGIGLAWINTITVAPALLSLLWKNPRLKRPAAESPPPKASDRLLRWLAQPRPIFALVLAAAMLAGTGGLIHLKADTDYVKFFRPGSSVRNDYAQLDRLGMPGSYLTVTVRLKGDTRFADIDRHRAMRRFENSLASLPGVIDVQSLDGRLESFASELGGGDAGGPAPNPAPILESLLALPESGQMEASDDFLAEDGRLIKVRVMTGPMSTRDINHFRDDLDKLAADQAQNWEIALTGTNVLWANMDAHVVSTQLLSIAITAAILLVLLPLVFQSLVLGILGFIVSFVPVLCTLGVMAWLGLPVNIATCILGGVVIGLSVDDTIYFLSRVREGLQLGLPVNDASQRAIGTTGRAMIKTSLILSGGFLTMAASDFMPSVFFGLFFAFSILVALLADLIVLPVLLGLTAKGLTNAKPLP